MGAKQTRHAVEGRNILIAERHGARSHTVLHAVKNCYSALFWALFTTSK